MIEKIFFQSSFPRSGSTLFCNVLGQHPDFYVGGTSGVLELIYAARENYSKSPEFLAQDAETMKKGFYGFCRAGLTGFYESITDKKYVLDKSRGWLYYYKLLNEILPEPKIIVMIRDIRDILSSMEKKIRNNPDKSTEIINWNNMTGITTEQRVNIWLNSQPLGLAMTRLYQMMHEGIDKNALIIKYEDFCLRPQQEMTRVYEYLGLDYFENDFENIAQLTVEDDNIYGVLGDHKIRSVLEMYKSDAQSILGSELCKKIKEGNKWFYDKYNYR